MYGYKFYFYNKKERIFLKTVSAVLDGGLMTLCLPISGTA